MALDYIIGGLQLLSAAVNVLALGAFWISPGLRATANRFVINLLIANIIACLALTPALWYPYGGLKTRFHMDNGVASTVETIYQSSPNLQFETDIRKIQHTDHAIDSTVNPLHHHRHHQNQQQLPQQTYSYHSANRYERDVEQQPDTIDSSVQSTQIRNNKIEKSIESLVIERDERGNIRKFTEKQVVDIHNGDGDKDELVEIVEEIDAEPASIGSERMVNAESIATIKQKSSTAHQYRAYTVFSENALIFDCTRFFGFDFAAAVGKQYYPLHIYKFTYTFSFSCKNKTEQTNQSYDIFQFVFLFHILREICLFICLAQFYFFIQEPPYCQPYQ